MNGQEAFRRFAQQVQRAGGQGGGGFSGGPGRFLAGGGLLAALIGGGLLLNASLFNGASFHLSQPLRESCWYCLKLMVVTVLSSIRGKSNKAILGVCLIFVSSSLRGVGDEVYSEGTHIMVCALPYYIPRPFSCSRYLGLRHQSSLTSVPSPGVLQA